MNETYNVSSVFRLKRATSVTWEKLNPVLEAGEPGFDMTYCGIKVGDGITHWKDLPFVGETEVVNKNTHYDFPSIGKTNTIYKAEKEKLIYQWNPELLIYEPLGASGNIVDVSLIDGGNAYGINT